MNKNVFIIHGHDSVALLELKEFLRKINIVPIVLKDQPNQNLTIIEKFEKYASKAAYAIAILTPDDKQASELGRADKFRARQNVIVEAGWFMGKLGRSKVIMLHSGNIELPSDVMGILYLSFRDSVLEVTEQLRDELKAQGLI